MIDVDCGGCGRALPPGAERCMYCGRSAGSEHVCPTCQRPLARSATRCMYCGPIQAGAPAERSPEAPSYREPPPPTPPPRVVAAPPGGGKLTFLETPRQRLIAALSALLVLVLATLSCVYYWPAAPGVDPEVAVLLEPLVNGWAESADTAEYGAPRVRGALVPLEIDYPNLPEPEAMDRLGPVPSMMEPVRIWSISELSGLLDRSLQPDGPGDVGTVALIDCNERVVGRYETGYGENAHDAGAARQWVCQLELVDVVARRRVDRVAFYGSHPPRAVAEGGRQIGTNPRYEIAAYLNDLPRQ